jgi:hypothetical protein
MENTAATAVYDFSGFSPLDKFDHDGSSYQVISEQLIPPSSEAYHAVQVPVLTKCCCERYRAGLKCLFRESFTIATDIHEPYGGSRQSGISASKQTNNIFLFTGAFTLDLMATLTIALGPRSPGIDETTG